MREKTYVQVSIAIIIMVALIRIVFALTHTVSGDACWHLSAVRFIATENTIPLFEPLGRLQPFWAPPLFHLVGAFFYKSAGFIHPALALASTKLVSPLFGTGAVILIYLIARRLFDEAIGFYTIIGINFLPVFLDYTFLSYVASTVTFFSVLSVYSILRKWHILSYVSLGLALLSKYNAAFVVPMVIYLTYVTYSNKQEAIKKIVVGGVVSFLIATPWFLRNYFLLDNPIWPFLNNVFKGSTIGTTFGTSHLASLLTPSVYMRSYLELFGLPNGSLGLFSLISLPFISFLIAAWVFSTIVFSVPLLRFFAGKKGRKATELVTAIYILIGSFFVMFVLYVLSLGWFGSRLFMPLLPFVAILWAIGLKSFKFHKPVLIIILFISSGFLISEVLKITFANAEWGQYDEDFRWARDNTAPGALFFGNGQCVAFNINRPVISHIAEIDFRDVDYLWVNTDWDIDFVMPDEVVARIKNSGTLAVVYENKETGTTIYQVTQ